MKMFNINNVIKRNNQTFYDYESGEVKSIIPKFLFILVISILFTVILGELNEVFLNAVLTVQAILVGFSFSVLFYLLSSTEPYINDDGSIEKKLKREKLSKLSQELFYNVSYFNLSTIFCVLIILIILLPQFNLSGWVTWIERSENMAAFLQNITEISRTLFKAAKYIMSFLFYFSLIESMFTFIRTVGRVSYYFEQKLLLISQQNDSP